MDESIKKIIEIIENLESRINSYWNFYIIIVVATVGWLMSSKTPFTTNQGAALTIAIGLFFISNFLVMRAATKRIVAFEDELNSISRSHEFNSSVLKNELSKASMQRRLFASYVLHGVIDIVVIYAIWSKLA